MWQGAGRKIWNPGNEDQHGPSCVCLSDRVQEKFASPTPILPTPGLGHVQNGLRMAAVDAQSTKGFLFAEGSISV